MERFPEQTAVVTGAARGIGRATAERLAAEGAHVVIVDIADGSSTVEAISANGGSAVYREGDVTDESRMVAICDDESIDMLVNNAGYYAPLAGPADKRRFDEITVEQWDRVMDVNAKGTFVASKAALPSMVDGGRIVNVASGTVLKGVPGFLHYVASKAAVVGMTRAMSNELADRAVRVNTVMPGLTATEVTTRKARDRLDAMARERDVQGDLRPDHIADAVCYLCSAESEMVTGQVLNVDGGVSYY